MMQYANSGTRSVGTACVAATLLAVSLMTTPPANAQPMTTFDHGSPFPLHCEPCSMPVPDNTVRLFEDYHFRGEYVDLRIDASPPNEMLNLGRTSLRGRASSARWNLPPGVLVLLHETGGWLDRGPGRQYAIWGHGQIMNLRDVDFNDKTQAWAWFYIGAESRRHICTPHCHDHYYDGERMIYIKGDHRHGPGCGHTWNGTYWVRSNVVPTPSIHVCTRQCEDHYFDGQRLVTIRGHRHGPNCGHMWNGRHWVDAVDTLGPSHVCTRGCTDHYYDGQRYITIKGHRHGPDCGHRWNGKYWIAVK